MTAPKDPIKYELWRARQSAAQKGKTPWNKGIPATEERKRKQSLAMKGRKITEEQSKQRSISRMGHTTSVETRQKISKAHMGMKHSQETKQKLSKISKGRKLSEVTKQRMSEASTGKYVGKNNHMYGRTGSRSPRWKGGKTAFACCLRGSFEYRSWTLAVFERDKFTCQSCKKRGGDLESHHIKPFAKILDEGKITTFDEALACAELWDVSNGITYCRKCHESVHYGENV